MKKPPRPQTIPETFIKKVDRFIRNKPTIADSKSGNIPEVCSKLGDENQLNFQAVTAGMHSLCLSDTTQYLDDECLSSRMLTHNTLAHKLEIMKRNSKRSAVFCQKTSKSILSPEQNHSFSHKLITTPSIPMPERFYYEQNP